MLEPLGLSPADEKVYTTLVTHPGLSVPALSQNLDLEADKVRSSLDRLLGLRLIRPVSGRPESFMPTRSDAAIGALVHRRLADLDDLMLTLEHLLVGTCGDGDSAGAASPLEVVSGPTVTGRSHGYHVIQDLMSTVRHEAMGLDRATASYAIGSSELAAEVPLLERGVRVRCVYQASNLLGVGRLPYVRRLVALGEQARVHPELALPLMIFDRRIAWLPLDAGTSTTHTSVLVHPSPLLDALIALFEVYWQAAADLPPAADADPRKGLPETGAGRPGPTPQERRLLALLATGLHDEAIAEALGVSLSTFRRRLGALMSRLGANSRFQAAAVAHKRGWL